MHLFLKKWKSAEFPLVSKDNEKCVQSENWVHRYWNLLKDPVLGMIKITWTMWESVGCCFCNFGTTSSNAYISSNLFLMDHVAPRPIKHIFIKWRLVPYESFCHSPTAMLYRKVLVRSFVRSFAYAPRRQ